MKKSVAIVLAALLVMVNAAALADVEPSKEIVLTENGFTKTYASTDTEIIPKEELTFKVTPSENNPDTEPTVTVAGYKAIEDKKAATDNLQVTIPSYTKPGVYTYTITEKAGNAQGETYSTASVGLTVLVDFDYTDPKYPDGKLVAHPGITKNAEGNKDDDFQNLYEVGDLEISKTVTGNLGSKTEYFDVEVTLNATKNVQSEITISGGSHASNPANIALGWTGEKKVNLKIKDGETIKLENVPKDVSYTVVEAAAHAAEDPTYSDPTKGYTVTYANEKGDATNTGNTTAAAVKTAITNDKANTPDTGIVLDTMPYMLLMLLAAAGFMMIGRKREEY
jgi:pilin isopeptide linkage protein